MTRFARAKGSKSSNERLPERATSWGEMKQQMEQKKQEIEFNKKQQEANAKREANYKAFLEEKENDELKETKWADFPGVTPAKTQKNKKNKQIVKEDDDLDDYLQGEESDDEEFCGLKAQLDEILDKKQTAKKVQDSDSDSDAPPEEATAKTEVKQVVVKKVKLPKKKLLKIVTDTQATKLQNDKEVKVEKVKKKQIEENNEDKKVKKNKIEENNNEDKKDLTEADIVRIEKKKARRVKQIQKKAQIKAEKRLQEQESKGTKRKSEETTEKPAKKIKKSPEELTDADKAKIEKKKAKKLKQLEMRKKKKEELKKQKEEQKEEENTEVQNEKPIPRKLPDKNFNNFNNNNNKKQNTEVQNEKPIPRKLPDKNFNNFNSNNNKKVGKMRDKQEHPRKKPFLPTKMMINGKEVEVDYIEGFPVKKEDAERLKKLKKEMISKGLPRSEINVALKLERRKAEKAFAREKKKVCFNCRRSGHNLSECPELGKNQIAQTAGSGICFKCGSTEHTHFECKVVRGQEFKFASCFICNEQGHIARQCPDNARGLYPKGGACNVCGDVTHLKKDCPRYQAQQQKQSDDVHLETFSGDNPDVLQNQSHNISWSNKHKPNKIIKF